LVTDDVGLLMLFLLKQLST